MKKEEGILITLPNIGVELIAISIIKDWEFKEISSIGDNIFCKFEDNTYISMSSEDYFKVFGK